MQHLLLWWHANGHVLKFLLPRHWLVLHVTLHLYWKMSCLPTMDSLIVAVLGAFNAIPFHPLKALSKSMRTLLFPGTSLSFWHTYHGLSTPLFTATWQTLKTVLILTATPVIFSELTFAQSCLTSGAWLDNVSRQDTSDLLLILSLPWGRFVNHLHDL